MILEYLLLLVFSILMVLIGCGLTIAGIIKNNQKLWIISLCGVVVFSLLATYSFYSTIKTAVDCTDTECVTEEVEYKTSTSPLSEDIVERMAEKSGKIVGKGIKAFASGIDESTGKTLIFKDESIEKSGISIGRAEQMSNSVGLFLEFANDFEGKLCLSAYDSEGVKQNISELEINAKTGSAKIYTFPFEYFNPDLTGYCILSKQK